VILRIKDFVLRIEPLLDGLLKEEGDVSFSLLVVSSIQEGFAKQSRILLKT